MARAARTTAFLLAYHAFAVGHEGDLARAEALVRSLGDAANFEADLALKVRGWFALLAGAHDRAKD